MTFSLRRKRPTTALEPRTPVTTAIEATRRRLWAPLAAGALLASALTAAAQTPPPEFPGPVPVPPWEQPERPASLRSTNVSTGTVTWLTEDPQAPPAAKKPVVQPIQQVAMQRVMDNRAAALGDETQDYHIRLTPPGPETLFGRRDSEAQLLERMRQEALSQTKPERIEFPKEQGELTKEAYAPRPFPPSTCPVEPNYTCYQRLNFEQLNTERYGWDLGYIAPFVATAVFFKDVLFLPYHIGTEPCRRYECNAGYCLPGTPVPLLLYPPEFSLTGIFLEATAVAGVLLVFPG
jgi:hypothetical protein